MDSVKDSVNQTSSSMPTSPVGVDTDQRWSTKHWTDAKDWDHDHIMAPASKYYGEKDRHQMRQRKQTYVSTLCFLPSRLSG